MGTHRLTDRKGWILSRPFTGCKRVSEWRLGQPQPKIITAKIPAGGRNRKYGLSTLKAMVQWFFYSLQMDWLWMKEAAVICGWRIARGWRTIAEEDWERWWRCSFGLNIEFNVQHHLQERDENEDGTVGVNTICLSGRISISIHHRFGSWLAACLPACLFACLWVKWLMDGRHKYVSITFSNIVLM